MNQVYCRSGSQLTGNVRSKRNLHRKSTNPYVKKHVQSQVDIVVNNTVEDETIFKESPTIKLAKHPRLNYSTSYQNEFQNLKEQNNSQITIKDIMQIRSQPFIQSSSVIKETTHNSMFQSTMLSPQPEQKYTGNKLKNLPMLCPSTTYQSQYYNMGQTGQSIQPPKQQTHTVDFPLQCQTTYNSMFSPMKKQVSQIIDRSSKIKRLGPLDFLLTAQKDKGVSTPFENDRHKYQDSLVSTNTPTFQGQYITEKNRQYQPHFGFLNERPQQIPSKMRIFFYSRDYE